MYGAGPASGAASVGANPAGSFGGPAPANAPGTAPPIYNGAPAVGGAAVGGVAAVGGAAPAVPMGGVAPVSGAASGPTAPVGWNVTGDIPSAWSEDRPRGASLEPPDLGPSATQPIFTKMMLLGLTGAGLVIAIVSCLLGSVVGIPLRGESAPEVNVKVSVSPSPVYVTVTPSAPDGAAPSDGTPSDGTPDPGDGAPTP
ncbi:hypothetical protein CryarDRAFT_1475 [Cryptosporangium arvum DSM 44712]|uniref:Uncharacterized protein n=1 Tax=Cryptosporangium arvum DSM 44712 TaxID=927661 RepID=A0A010ZT63_9ACTN|nr:hypothetical protein CryarDRAFT_1475 [Cryptosporangium arvum DSM 44712]